MAQLEADSRRMYLAEIESESPRYRKLFEGFEEQLRHGFRSRQELRAWLQELRRREIKEREQELEHATGEERTHHEAAVYHEQLKRQFENAEWRLWLPLPMDHQSEAPAKQPASW
jgi:hypothetical protein